MEPDKSQEGGQYQNYLTLKAILEAGLANASQSVNLREAKGFLIDVQNHFKGLVLRREDREELYTRLQDAFAAINRKIEDERLDFELTALSNYAGLKPDIEKASVMATDSENTREAWDFLLDVQNRVKSTKLTREHRDELFGKLQGAFEMIKLRRDEERQQFDQESKQNYTRLKALVEKGLLQAEESHEYKETREFLKKIQADFKGLKLAREQREELYSRLQTAFDILGKRLDDFFRYKKKNWEVKMQFTLSRLSADIFELQEAMEKEKSYLIELEDHREIIISSDKDKDALIGVESRIISAKRSIEQKLRQIAGLEIEKEELKNRLEEPDE
ncbi:MAG: hypothetical protein WCK34_03495 [Bacteroidota bacterium]